MDDLHDMNAQVDQSEHKGPDWEPIAEASPESAKSSKSNQKRPMESGVSKTWTRSWRELQFFRGSWTRSSRTWSRPE